MAILEHSLKAFYSNRFSIFTQGVVERSLWKRVIFLGHPFLEIKPSGLILVVGDNLPQVCLIQFKTCRHLNNGRKVVPIPVDVPIESTQDQRIVDIETVFKFEKGKDLGSKLHYTLFLSGYIGGSDL